MMNVAIIRAGWLALACALVGCGASSDTPAGTSVPDATAPGPDASMPPGGDDRSTADEPFAATSDDSSDDSSVITVVDTGSSDANEVGSPEAGAITAVTGNVGPLAATPPMGWNSWNRFKGGISDAIVRQIADAAGSSGMVSAGYAYIIIDDTWQSSRDANGNIVPDPNRFPNMKALADYVHSRGLKFGLYSDRGTQTCGGFPGSYGHETQDAQMYASWGVDYLKYDNCNPSPSSLGMEQDYTTMGNALIASGRPIVYSICAWWFYPWQPAVGNLWRTTTDITDTWASVTSLIDRNGGDTARYGSCTSCPDASGGSCVICNGALPEAAYGAPGISAYASSGHWNDPDMLEVGNGAMTDTEYRSHFSMWAMMAAPLIAGNDLRTMTAATTTILTNPDVIAVDQDARGVQGTPISASTTLEVWSKPLSGAATYAVALFNRTDAAATIGVTFTDLGIASGHATVRDLWAHADLGSMSGQYQASVPSHGVAMLRVVGQ